MKAKICGLGAARDLEAAFRGGAAYVGFVFYPPSPRALTLARAAALAALAPPGIAKVGLFVDPDNSKLDSVISEVPLDYVQLHGSEDPARITEIRKRSGLPVIKSVRIGASTDLHALETAEEAADVLLCDTAAEDDGALPGGNGAVFDWHRIAGRPWRRPWLLAGGLTPENVAEAIRISGAEQVDVSSGVESEPGCKSPDRIAAFLDAAGVLPRAGS